MKKQKVASVKKTGKDLNVELDPEAWPKFEALVKSAAKMGHKSHEKTKSDNGKR
jgi:hypothetical protein